MSAAPPVKDVRGRALVIEAGRYKDVNALGASTIIALRNALPEIQLPFVFGGDGATLLVPASEECRVRGVLLGLKRMAQEAFSLNIFRPRPWSLAMCVRTRVIMYTSLMAMLAATHWQPNK
jgi:hypothetical protein